MPLRALVFDVFGTLVDWRTGVADEVRAICAEHALTVDGEAVADSWRRRYQPSMERVRAGVVGWRNLDVLHRESLDEVLIEAGLDRIPAADRDQLNRAWHRLRPWPDARDGLAELAERFILSTLSNGNFSLLTELIKNADLPFDCILSAELFQAYKPDPRTYSGAARLLGLHPAEVMLVAAHPDDLRAAAACGLRTGYIDRPLEWGHVDHVMPTDGFDVIASTYPELAAKLGAMALRG